MVFFLSCFSVLVFCLVCSLVLFVWWFGVFCVVVGWGFFVLGGILLGCALLVVIYLVLFYRNCGKCQCFLLKFESKQTRLKAKQSGNTTEPLTSMLVSGKENNSRYCLKRK